MTETAADLVKRYNQLDDWVSAENKRFSEHLKPVKEQMEAIKSKLHEMLLALGSSDKQSISTDYGTVYTQRVMTPKIADRDKFLDAVNEHWDQWGNEMLQLGKPQVGALRDYMEKHGDALPPGVEVNYFINVNIRRG